MAAAHAGNAFFVTHHRPASGLAIRCYTYLYDECYLYEIVVNAKNDQVYLTVGRRL